MFFLSNIFSSFNCSIWVLIKLFCASNCWNWTCTVVGLISWTVHTHIVQKIPTWFGVVCLIFSLFEYPARDLGVESSCGCLGFSIIYNLCSFYATIVPWGAATQDCLLQDHSNPAALRSWQLNQRGEEAVVCQLSRAWRSSRSWAGSR
jgi:hypothetical protein